MSNESSIEWIIKRLIFKTEFENLPNQYVLMSDKDIDSTIQQAKAMHKEEMDKVSEDWWNEGANYMYNGQRKYNSFEQYYNETFGGNNEQL